MAFRKTTRQLQEEDTPDDDRDYGAGGPDQASGDSRRRPGAQGLGDQPIGVDKGYRAPVVRPDLSSLHPSIRRGAEEDVLIGAGGRTSYGRPLYYEGAEMLPGLGTADSITNMQVLLAKAGLLHGPFAKGTWDPPSIRAYKNLLQIANVQGRHADTVLNGILNEQETGGRWTVGPNGEIIPMDGGVAAQPLVTQQTDPGELERIFRAIIVQETGTSWEPERISRLVTAYQSMEVQAQQQAYDMGLEGGNVVDVPSPEAFAMDQAEEQDMAGVQEQNYLEAFEDFSSLASSPAWGAQ